MTDTKDKQKTETTCIGKLEEELKKYGLKANYKPRTGIKVIIKGEANTESKEEESKKEN